MTLLSSFILSSSLLLSSSLSAEGRICVFITGELVLMLEMIVCGFEPSSRSGLLHHKAALMNFELLVPDWTLHLLALCIPRLLLSLPLLPDVFS